MCGGLKEVEMWQGVREEELVTVVKMRLTLLLGRVNTKCQSKFKKKNQIL